MIGGLIESEAVRVEYAVIPLLLRHPEFAPPVCEAAAPLPPAKVERLRRHYSIALTKLARSAARDTIDVSGMIRASVIDCATLHAHYESVLARYKRRVTRGDWMDFQRKVETFYAAHCKPGRQPSITNSRLRFRRFAFGGHFLLFRLGVEHLHRARDNFGDVVRLALVVVPAMGA